VNVQIEGIAASAASIIAMAGDSIVMSRGAVMMIHDPSGMTMGTASDHQKSIDGLNAIADSMASVYAERTGRTIKAERQAMTNETWMTDEQAVAQGYADRLDLSVDTPPVEPSAWNYALYSQAPQNFVALAQAKGWSRATPIDLSALPPPKPRGAIAAHSGQKEIPMTDTTAADAKAAADKEAADKLAAENAAKAEADAKASADAAKAAADNATKRAADIAALCKLAGQADKTADYIASDKSMDDIRDELLKAKAAADKTGNVDHRHKVDPVAPAVDAKAWERTVAKINGRIAA
jgi:hypothetical protein